MLAVLLLAAPAAFGQELYLLGDDGQTMPLAQAPATPAHGRPVLFVHGHNALSATDDDFNFRKNWVEPLGTLPSFAQTLVSPDNQALDIEAYFIRFADQARSIVADAAELRAALGVILQRHDPAYDPADSGADTDVQIVLVAYSKGTLSARLVLKSLVEAVDGMAPPQPDLRPVSEFIAIAPPNHGLRTLAALVGSATSGDELNNGYGPPLLGGTVCAPIGSSAARDFIERLNGHDMADSHADAVPLGEYATEAPGSRSPGAPASEGVLYLSLYASGNRDFVGGDVPPGAPGNTVETAADCDAPVRQGRVLARNLAPDAINLALTSITGADAIEVHGNTVHTGAVICQALHTAVHGHPPTEGECLLAPGDVPIISPPRRVAVQLVLDYSMSMQHAACAVCAPRFTTLTQAAQLFVDLWELVAAPGDHLGVTHFRSDVTRMRCVPGQPCDTVASGAAAGASTLVPLKQNAEAIRNHLAEQVPGGTTALGGALDSALDDLQSFDGERKRILLFTDGMQNVPPLVETVPVDCVAGECGLVIQGEPPRSLDESLDIAIDTIGIGAGDAYLSLLGDIALATGGVSRTTLNPDEDLQAYFVDDVIDVLQGYSPQRVARRRGQLGDADQIETFAINRSARRVIFHWPGNIEARIVKDGIDLTPLGRRVVRPGYGLWTLRLPATVDGHGPVAGGDWRIHLSGRPGQVFDVSALVDEPVLGFSVSTGARRYRVGDSLALSARIRAAGVPIDAPVDLSVRVWRPGSSAANIIATQTASLTNQRVNLEAGASAGEQNLARLLNNKELRFGLTTTTSSLPMTSTAPGRYSTASAPVTVPGSYRVEFHLAGEHPSIGRFERTRSQTVHVAFARADFDSTAFSATRRRPKNGTPTLTLTVSPRDSYGNYLGPGYATRVAAIIDGKPSPAPEDLGDGRYAFAFDGDTPRSATLVLRVMGEPLMDGLLADVEPPPPLPRRPMWQYAIALLLVLLTLWLFRRARR